MANEGGKSGPDGLDVGQPLTAIQNIDVGSVVMAHTHTIKLNVFSCMFVGEIILA